MKKISLENGTCCLNHNFANKENKQGNVVKDIMKRVKKKKLNDRVSDKDRQLQSEQQCVIKLLHQAATKLSLSAKL